MTIDAHQHFWKYQPARDTWITEDMSAIRRDFLPPDLEPLLKENKIEGSVSVQADQSEKETEFLIHHARENSFVKGVVGWTDLLSPHAQARLEYYYQFSEIKGFRHVVQSEPDDNFLLRKDFCTGVSLLAQYRFTYDILVYPRHLPAVLEFIKKFPDQPFVIDHLAKPFIKDRITEPWAKLMREIGRAQNVYCKISGMVTEADWKNWKPADIQPFFETVLEAFGPGRLMYGSDWPVCQVAATYDQQYQLVASFIQSLSPSEKKMILGGNAERFYHL